MRFPILAMAAALLLIPATPAVSFAAGASGPGQAQSTDFSAAKRKKAKKSKASKVEYMRAVPAK